MPARTPGGSSRGAWRRSSIGPNIASEGAFDDTSAFDPGAAAAAAAAVRSDGGAFDDGFFDSDATFDAGDGDDEEGEEGAAASAAWDGNALTRWRSDLSFDSVGSDREDTPETVTAAGSAPAPAADTGADFAAASGGPSEAAPCRAAMATAAVTPATLSAASASAPAPAPAPAPPEPTPAASTPTSDEHCVLTTIFISSLEKGLGLTLRVADGVLTVGTVKPEGAAAAAGVEAGDALVQVNGRRVHSSAEVRQSRQAASQNTLVHVSRREIATINAVASGATPAVVAPSLPTPSVATPSVATPALATPALATPALAMPTPGER